MINKRDGLNRRSFLGVAAAVCASPLFLKSSVLGRDGFVPPSEKLVSALIGFGNRGHDLINSFTPNPNFKMIGVCDCYQKHAQEGADRVNEIYQNKDCIIFPKYEDVLQRGDLDVVVIGTPDHWHTKLAVESCKAGKDVFCEKPLTLTLAEGRQIIAAARKYNRVCSSGSQRVMEDYGYMAPVIQSGAIGDVKEVYIGLGPAGKTCYLPEETIPEGFDWERWLGQAPYVPYNKDRCSGDYGGGWRNYEEYGNGFLADWGAHKFGGSLYALGLDTTDPVEIIPPDGKDVKYMTLIFKNGIKFYHVTDGSHDITFVGTEREYRHEVDRDLKPLKVVEVRRYSGGANNITDDFAYSVKHRIRPFQDFQYGAHTAAFCQLANIGYKVNRPLKWDQEKCQFVDDEQANRLVSRVQRSPYTIEV
ncbi:MAG: Gfo/Idh/MocA family oxidoreductase [Planctomycetaceae bacterium]|nr:Gfo/Idh/MocA family oxidoreductase [Planctomycetaceae bacterium]